MFDHDKDSSFLNWTPKKQQEKNLIRWIEALISGDYQQGFGRLYDSSINCYCATGVAADAVGRFKRTSQKYLRLPFSLGLIEVSRDGFYFGFEANSLKELRSTFEVPFNWFFRTFGLICSKTFQNMNDTGESFAEIAAILVTYLPSSERRTELSFIIADKLADKRTARRNMEQPTAPKTVADDGLPSEGYFNHP